MSLLVGKYLVSSVDHGIPGAHGVEWRSTWHLSVSPSGDGRDWQLHEHGLVDGVFTTVRAAVEAAELAGVKRAREIQGDDSLQPREWRLPFPEVEPHGKDARS
jgi:hypothetical protein